jgi:hypothetical protein
MTRSVAELRRESERSRAELAATVDQLRERISDTAEDIRHKVSRQHIKAEVSDYIGHKTQSWVGALKQQAMDNPMQAIAAGTAVAVPVLRLLRGSPLPLLTIGAGLALTSKTVRDRAAEAAAPAMDKAREMLDEAAGRAQALRGDIQDAVSSAQSQASGLANDAQGTAAGVADDLRTRAAQTTSTVTDKLKSGMDAAKDAIEQARSSAKEGGRHINCAAELPEPIDGQVEIIDGDITDPSRRCPHPSSLQRQLHEPADRGVAGVENAVSKLRSRGIARSIPERFHKSSAPPPCR